MNPDQIEDLYELSSVQHGMLFHSLLTPERALYVQNFSCLLDGPLHLPALQQALDQMLARHPVLRTSFHWEQLDKPLQMVHRRVALAIDEEDWRDLPVGEHEARLAALQSVDAARKIDLESPPLMRLDDVGQVVGRRDGGRIPGCFARGLIPG